ncbi:hypothetical protein JCGZ_20154 [Jatropha curcas]|uniref:Co-chaperone protein p23 n=1 Tax=Jatropha curcas TaxID=180498 RepID=A0A067K6R4_JATCU|nr:hypothetical protein JCGZ_20154 [Jatropha curcas]
MSDKLLITAELPDAQDVKLKLEPEGKFSFSATSGVDKIPYEVELDLLDKVNVELRVFVKAWSGQLPAQMMCLTTIVDEDSDDRETEEDSVGDAHAHSAEEEAAAYGSEELDIKKT